MASTYTNLGVEKPGNGEQSGVWGNTADTSYDSLDASISGFFIQALADTNTTITITDGVASNARNRVIKFTGTLTANRTITIAPSDLTKTTLFWNATTGGFSLVFSQGTGATTYTLPNGLWAEVVCDGANHCYNAFDLIATSRQVATATGLSGGGALTADRTIALDINSLTEDTTPDKAADFALTYDTSAAGHKKVKLSNISTIGKHLIPILATGLQVDISGSIATFNIRHTSVNFITFRTMDFPTSVVTQSFFTLHMPSSWNAGTVTFRPVWMSDVNTAGNVAWELKGMARSDGDTLDTAYGTGQTSIDTFQLSKLCRGPESSAITISGTPAANDTVFFCLSRLTAGDTYGSTAGLIGIELYITTNADVDTA